MLLILGNKWQVAALHSEPLLIFSLCKEVQERSGQELAYPMQSIPYQPYLSKLLHIYIEQIRVVPYHSFSFVHRLTRLDLLRLSRIFIRNLSGSAYRINPYQGANVPNDMSLLQSKESTDINPRCLPDPLHQFLCLNIR